MDAMERKSEEGGGGGGIEGFSSFVRQGKCQMRVCLSFRPLSSLPRPFPLWRGLMYGFINGGFTYFCRLKWREEEGGGRLKGKPAGLKGKVPRARAVFLLLVRMVNRLVSARSVTQTCN